MQWYYLENGVQQGPVSDGQLREVISSGRITNQSLVWREGMGDWLPVSQVPELDSSGAVVPPPAPQSPYQPPTSHPGGAVGSMVEVPSYLWQSIVVTLLCCLPAGIVAIVYASKVDSLLSGGDVAGAQAASGSAKTWCWVSLGLGLLFGLIFVGGGA